MPLSRHKRQKLEKNLRKVGLVATVVWNKTTGNVVGGHQRLAALDALEGNGDYELDVAVVELDDQQEMAQNIFLNNPLVQGTWDIEALAGLLRSNDFDVAASGFDPMDVQVMFDDPKLAPLFNSESNDDAMSELQKIGAVQAPNQAAAPAVRAGADELEEGPLGDDELPEEYEASGEEGGEGDDDAALEPYQQAVRAASDLSADEREKWREIKARQRARVEEHIKQDDTEFYAVVGFADPRQRAVLCQLLGLEKNASFMDGARMFERLKRSARA